MLVAVMKQFAKILAHGVIRPINELQIEPNNVLMVLPVKKKDDDGNVLNILNALRLQSLFQYTITSISISIFLYRCTHYRPMPFYDYGERMGTSSPNITRCILKNILSFERLFKEIHG